MAEIAPHSAEQQGCEGKLGQEMRSAAAAPQVALKQWLSRALNEYP